MTDSLLIRGGAVIDTSPAPHVIGPADIQIDAGRIAAVGPDLPKPPGAEVIDATGLIVLPGFVDTHRHTYQAVIRLIGPDLTLPGYLRRVLRELVPRYRPEHLYAGNLAGALDCLNSGITTLVDWSHLHPTPEYTDAAVAALRQSGIRGVLGYCHPGGGPGDLTEVLNTGRRTYREHFGGGSGDGLLSMAIAPFGPELDSEERALAEWRLALELDLPVTVHMGGYGPQSATRGLAFLEEHGLLGPRVTYVHANSYTDDQFKLIADSGGAVSVSPLIEAELGIGYPISGRAHAAGVPASLGADTVVSGPGDMFTLMRTAYAMERARHDGAGMGFTVADALRMATIDGARAAGLADSIGSLHPGKQADLVLLRTDTLTMAPAHDLVGAVVLGADPNAVDTVLVAGRTVKRDGRLLNHDMAAVLTGLRESAVEVTKA